MKSVHAPGKGTLAVPLFALAMACSHTPTPTGPVPSSETLIPLVEAQAQKAEPAGQLVAPHYLSATTEEDGRTDWNLPLQEGQCYTFSGIGGQGVKQLYLYLWDQAEKRVATEKPERPAVTLRYCPDVSGTYHLQAKTGEGFGPLAVGVYSVLAPPKAAPPPPDSALAIIWRSWWTTTDATMRNGSPWRSSALPRPCSSHSPSRPSPARAPATAR